MAEVHFMPDASDAGRAATVITAGYTSRHGVAALTLDELRGMGFKPGNAKRIASYLGGSAVIAAAPASPDNVSAAMSQQQSAQLGAAVAMAVTTAQKVIVLHDGPSRPTVSAGIKWAKKHLDKVNLVGYRYTSLMLPLQALLDDFGADWQATGRWWCKKIKRNRKVPKI